MLRSTDERYNGEKEYTDLFSSLGLAAVVCTVVVSLGKQFSPHTYFFYMMFYLLVFTAMLLIVHHYNHLMKKNSFGVTTSERSDNVTRMLSECRD